MNKLDLQAEIKSLQERSRIFDSENECRYRIYQ